jgi:hypothetical protein
MLRLLIVIGALYALGALTMLVATWCDRWPRLKASLLKLGEAAGAFALGLLGFALVVLILRAAGVLETQ